MIYVGHPIALPTFLLVDLELQAFLNYDVTMVALWDEFIATLVLKEIAEPNQGRWH